MNFGPGLNEESTDTQKRKKDMNEIFCLLKILLPVLFCFPLDIFPKEDYSILVRYLWARGSAGRAPRSQRGGRGFEPLRVHHHEGSRVFALLFSWREISRRGSKPQGSAGGGTVRWTVEPALVRDLREAGRRRKGRGSGPVDPFGSTITKEAGCLPCFSRGVKSAEGVRSRRAAPEAEQSGGLWSRRWLIDTAIP